LEFVWRYDGSYIFPEEGRWGFFPGVSAGWIISEENFWKNNISLVNYLKSVDRGVRQVTTGLIHINTLQLMVMEALHTFSIRIQKLLSWCPELSKQGSNLGSSQSIQYWFRQSVLWGRLAFSGDYFYNLRTKILWYRMLLFQVLPV